MPTNISIKNVPDDLAERLRRRAKRAHRSLQGELLTILEQAVEEDRGGDATRVLAAVRRLGLRTPAEAAAMIRADRDAR